MLSSFRADDLEMRDVTICALTQGNRFQGKTVAATFGILPSQVPRIRSRYRERGAKGLVHQMGRSPLLNPAQLRQARTWAGLRPHPRRDRPQTRSPSRPRTRGSASEDTPRQRPDPRVFASRAR